MMTEIRQLNPFEIKAEITDLINNFKDVNELSNYIEQIQLLDAQNDKKSISKLLFKELYNIKTNEATILCFLLERYADKDELVKKLWDLLKNNVVANNVKIVAINFLRGLDSNWELDSGDELLNAEIIDADTKKLLHNAIINPEIQIDFLDFLTSLSSNDKLSLLRSLGEDYSEDALANILIPVFLSQPDSEVGIEALKLLGESKSQLAFHALNSATEFADEKIAQLVKKSLSTLKIAGIREDNSHKFYKEILSDSKPYRFCITSPDGHGNQALIFSRKTTENKIRFVAIVIDDYRGIRDCFGFYEISQFECDKIIERFYKNEKEINVKPEVLKTIINNAENLSRNSANNWLLPYEYVCWKNLLADVEFDKRNFEEILNEKITKKDVTKSDLEFALNDDYCAKWFLNAGYSDEFEHVCNAGTDNFDKLVEENVDKVFYNEEKEIWSKRLLSVAYLKLEENDISSAEIYFNLYYNDMLKQEMYKQILKRSIYEYYVNLKFNTELNNGKYSLRELDTIIKQIEDLWVCTK